MALVRLFITKFNREVLIEDDHPLVLAERQAAASVVEPPPATTDSTAAPDNAPLTLTAQVVDRPARRRARS